MDEIIKLTADVVAVDPTGRVLLIQRADEPFAGCWALPGGHVDAEEDIPAAAIRELAEETGVCLTADELRELGTWGTPGRDPRGRYVTVAYLATVTTGTKTVAGTDARRAAWWPLDALPKLAFDHADILSAVTQRRPAPNRHCMH
ncbi:NUDIX domain-containing protein [Streptomyces sp. NPDC001520]|uniref:NUDIX domain-containing protein n=1 Tax=Streptomyces sp. NPDC001520 TaxID=3364581 RepID=UPI0036C1FA26